MKRILPLVMAALLLFGAASCSNNSQTPSDTTASGNTAADTAAETEKPREVVDLEGYNVKFLDRSYDYNIYYGSVDIYSEGLNGEVVNDAVYNRNAKVEGEYNVKITESSAEDLRGTAETSILAADSAYDVLVFSLIDIGNMALSDYLVSIYDLSGIDLTASCWDRRAIADLTMKGRLYAAMGDIIVQDDWGTWRVLFNKDITSQYNLSDPYKMVTDGTWTNDKMHSMAVEATIDINGDSRIDEEDQWGYTTESYNLYVHAAGSGEKYAVNNGDSYTLNIGSQRMLNAFEKAGAIMFDSAATFVKGNFKYTNTPADIWFDAISMFGEGRVLFDMGGVDNVSDFRAYDLNFGILPVPKLEETQEEYYCACSYGNTVAIAFPKQEMNYDGISLVVQAMAEESVSTLTEAYVETLLLGKSLYDSESESMLRLIMTSRCYDIAMQFNAGSCIEFASGLVDRQSTDFASEIAKIEGRITTDMDKVMDKLG